MDSKIYSELHRELVMVLGSRNELQNGCDIACKDTNAECATYADEYHKNHGTRRSRQIRTRRILSQSDSIRQSSSYGNRPKVQVYSKLSMRYARHPQVSSRIRGGSKWRGNGLRRNSTNLHNNRSRRNAVISRLDPVIERKVDLKETRQPSLTPDASIVENQIYCHHIKPVKGRKKRPKDIGIDVFAQLPVMDFSLTTGGVCTGNMLRKNRGSLGQSRKYSEPISVPGNATVTSKTKDDKRVDGSPKLDRLRQQLPLFLSSGSPPTSKKLIGKRTASPGTPPTRSWTASPVTHRTKNGWTIQVSISIVTFTMTPL